MKTKKQGKLLVLTSILILSIGILGFLAIYAKDMEQNRTNQDVKVMKVSSTSFSALGKENLSKYMVRSITITSVGDIMCHKWQINRAYDEATDTFDFAEAFTYIEKYLSESDFTVGNLETTLAGRNVGSASVLGYSGYPRFNSPEILAKNLKDIGFDLLTTANNHSIDSGYKGIVATLDELDKVGLLHTGTARSLEEKEKHVICDIEGIQVGFLGYTNITNGLSVPDENSYAINNIDYYTQSRIQNMCEEVQSLKENSDFVVVMIHFGNEYVTQPDRYQKAVADALFEAGADVILGSHPHVIQPMEIREIQNPDGTTRKGVVIYSLGNFISSQKYDEEGRQKDIGLILNLNLESDGINTKLCSVELIPTYVYWTEDVIGVVSCYEAYENKDAYSFLSEKDFSRITSAAENMFQHINSIGNYDAVYENERYIIPID
ncbi:MAG: CapA family protein [Lachnospiraceae bacterium]|nr:CapA family protein [Lachnospiraceae bacterium]